MVMKACSTFVAFLALVSKKGMPISSANACQQHADISTREYLKKSSAIEQWQMQAAGKQMEGRSMYRGRTKQSQAQDISTCDLDLCNGAVLAANPETDHFEVCSHPYHFKEWSGC